MAKSEEKKRSSTNNLLQAWAERGPSSPVKVFYCEYLTKNPQNFLSLTKKRRIKSRGCATWGWSRLQRGVRGGQSGVRGVEERRPPSAVYPRPLVLSEERACSPARISACRDSVME